jgi:hypothetical protein
MSATDPGINILITIHLPEQGSIQHEIEFTPMQFEGDIRRFKATPDFLKE